MSFRHEGFKVGERVRAFDFEPVEGRPARYLSGVIRAVDREGNGAHPFAHYAVVVDEDTLFDGKRIGEVAAVPMEVMFSEYDGRVVRLEEVGE